VLAGHAGDLHGWDARGILALGDGLEALGAGTDVDHHAFEGVEVVDGGEGFVVAGLVDKVGLCVGGCDDGEGSAERFFDFLVEMVTVTC
jgi:hypothetical protein